MNDDHGDATFEDGAAVGLRLTAADAEDLGVLSALCQDAVGRADRIRYDAGRRRLSLMLHRLRWEDGPGAATPKAPMQRVASALTVDDVLGVKATGLKKGAADHVFNLLALAFQPGEDGAGVLEIACAGEAALRVEVECLNVGLTDLTRPWPASSAPRHDL